MARSGISAMSTASSGNRKPHSKGRMRRKESLHRKTVRIGAALALFAVVFALDETGFLASALGTPASLYAAFAMYLVPFAIAGHDVLAKAARNIVRGRAMDESFLMAVATLGAFAMVLFPDSSPHMAEGAAVMLFYQVGELAQAYAVGRSRRDISALMDIAPDTAFVEDTDGNVTETDAEDVSVGSVVVVRPGSRVPLDGTVISGESRVNTSALTGESVPRAVGIGSDVFAGFVNDSGTLRVRATKPAGESAAARVLEMVSEASERKSRSEGLVTRFAKVYTPIVVALACSVAVVPPLLGLGTWSEWVLRGLTCLVVSCPCALVISVPLAFFGGIGGLSRIGVLAKGSAYIEALADVRTVVMDKTGTLTTGTFGIVANHPADGFDASGLLSLAAAAESQSTHPIAVAIRDADGMEDMGRADDVKMTYATDVTEHAGMGVSAMLGKRKVLAGNARLMRTAGIEAPDCEVVGTIVHVAVGTRDEEAPDGFDYSYAGHLVIADSVKPDAEEAVAMLRREGIRNAVMLTGDRPEVAMDVAARLGIDDVHASLMPGDKVAVLEGIMADGNAGKVAAVGDGINDAPLLTRADVGIAMGAMGSDAAIESADVVLMDDRVTAIPEAMRSAKRTVRIARENIWFSLAVKVAILAFAAVGMADMWLAVVGDVGVTLVAVANAMRAMHVDVRR